MKVSIQLSPKCSYFLMYVVLIECLNGPPRNSRLTLSNENVIAMYRPACNTLYHTAFNFKTKHESNQGKSQTTDQARAPRGRDTKHRTHILSNIQLKKLNTERT